MEAIDTEQQSQVAGVIEEVLPNALYRVALENGKRVTVSVSGALRHRVVRLIAGDRVSVRLSSFDPNRGQITEKL